MMDRPYRKAFAGHPMNRTRVIVAMTLAVFFVLGVPLVAIFGGIPPWPVIVWFAASHILFCVLIATTKPFVGPYQKPYRDPPLNHAQHP